jgi:hypothetical protein
VAATVDTVVARAAGVAPVRRSKGVVIAAAGVAVCILTIATATADLVGAAARFWGSP